MGVARIGKIRMKAGGAEIVPLRVVSVGDGYKFDPDVLLENAKGKKFAQLVIIAEREDTDELWISSMSNAGVSLMVLERAKLQLIRRS